MALPQSFDDFSVVRKDGEPTLKAVNAVDALMKTLLESTVKGKLARSIETSDVPSNGIVGGLTDNTRMRPLIGETKAIENETFDSMPKSEEYTTIGDVRHSDNAGDRTVTEKVSMLSISL